MKAIILFLTLFLILGCNGGGGSSGTGAKGSQSDSGGDWSSGGGENFGPHLNPWVVQNTAEITYCIIMSPDFGASAEEVQTSLDAAVAYWKREFDYFRQPGAPNILKVQLATQPFRKVDCSDQPTITFQMGFLTDAQREKIGNVEDYIGYAARTEYDPVNLRGRGFIYLASSDAVLQRFNFPGMDGRSFWKISENFLLESTLVHELGHVYGMTRTQHYMMKPIEWLLNAHSSRSEKPIRLMPGFGLHNDPNINYAFSDFPLMFDSPFQKLDEENIIRIKWVTEMNGFDFIPTIKQITLEEYTPDRRFVRKLGEGYTSFSTGDEEWEMGVFLTKNQTVFADEGEIVLNTVAWLKEDVSMDFFDETNNQQYKLFVSFNGEAVYLGYIDSHGNFAKGALQFDIKNPLALDPEQDAP